MDAEERSYREMNGVDTWTPTAVASVPSNGTIKHTGSPLDFIERTALDAQVSSDKILAITRTRGEQGELSGIASGEFAEARGPD